MLTRKNVRKSANLQFSVSRCANVLDNLDIKTTWLGKDHSLA